MVTKVVKGYLFVQMNESKLRLGHQNLQEEFV